MNDRYWINLTIFFVQNMNEIGLFRYCDDFSQRPLIGNRPILTSKILKAVNYRYS